MVILSKALKHQLTSNLFIYLYNTSRVVLVEYTNTEHLSKHCVNINNAQ